MASEANSRREFLKLGTAALANASLPKTGWSARSYAAIPGASDRVRTGVIGAETA